MTRAYFCAHVLFSAFLFLPPTTNAQDSYDPRVCFYELRAYAGEEYCVRESAQGMPRNLNGTDWNDAVSSLKLFDGAKVILFENVDYDRYMGTYVSNTWRLSRSDVVSSFKIIMPREPPGVCFYTAGHYGGREYCFTETSRSLTGDIADNNISSIRLSGEIFVEVRDSSTSEESHYITHDMPVLDEPGVEDAHWDDRPSINNTISWFKIHKYSETPLACLWDAKHFRGGKICTTSDIDDLADTHLNDLISSIRVYGNTVVNVYQDKDYTGNSTQTMHDLYDMDYLSDKISSVKVSVRKTLDFACLYDHLTYKGTAVCVEVEGQGAQLNEWDNMIIKASSIHIGGNVRARFYSATNFSGESMDVYHTSDNMGEFTGDINANAFDYTRDWSDQVKAFKVFPNSGFGSGDVAANTNYVREGELLEFNERLGRSVPFSSIMHTHNSFNSRNYGVGPGGILGANQHHAIAPQLEMGSRFFEIDIYYHPGGKGAFPRSIKVCHAVDCSNSSQRQALERIMSEIHNWFLGADEDDTMTIMFENGLPNTERVLVDIVPVPVWHDVEAVYHTARAILTTTLPDLIYTPYDAIDQGLFPPRPVGDCKRLPKDLTRQHVRAANKRVVLILSDKSNKLENCGRAGPRNGLSDITFELKPKQDDPYDSCTNNDVSFRTPFWHTEDEFWARKNEGQATFSNTRPYLSEEDNYIRCGSTGMSHDHINWDDIRPIVPLSDWSSTNEEGGMGPLLYGFLAYDDLPKPITNLGCILRRSKDGRSAALNPSHDDMYFETRSCASNLPYACQDEATGNWFITDSAGPWSEGAVACGEEVATANFAVPWNKYGMVTLENAAAQPVVDGTYVCTVDPETCPSLEAWVNLRARNGQWLPLANLAGTFPSKGTMSSQFIIPNPNATFDFDISNGIDNDGGVFSSMAVTNRDENAFYELDLRGVYFIDSIALWTVAAGWLLDVNKGGFSIFVSELTIPEMSRDDATGGWQSVPSYVTEYSFPLGASGTGVTSVDVGLSGRYVRFQLHGTDYLAFEEIRVYGY